ncbi:beta-glucan synthesis-associated protein KRE6, partial [Phenoliferia sp. Uapishka_3]
MSPALPHQTSWGADSRESVSANSNHRASASLDPASYGTESFGAVLTGAVGASSDVAIDLAPAINYDYGRQTPSDEEYDEDDRPMKVRLAEARKEVDTALLWDKSNGEVDDYLHNPSEVDRYMDSKMRTYSAAGIINTGVIAIIVIVLVGLFGGWPIYTYVIKGGFTAGSTDLDGGLIPGMIPNITGLAGLIDADTPTEVYQRTGFDGKSYNLVFSDEFNKDGRTFWPGDDPFWEAVDLHYWATTDLEWYDPDAVSTKGGNLEITMTEEPTHGLNFRSGMLQSWNKFCIQMAPLDAGYLWLNETPYIQIFNESRTTQNTWHGSVNQESASLNTLTDATSYDGLGYSTFGFEYTPGNDGKITWAMNASETWQLNANAMGPNADAAIGQRLVAAEPMSIVLNLAICLLVAQISSKSRSGASWISQVFSESNGLGRYPRSSYGSYSSIGRYPSYRASVTPSDVNTTSESLSKPYLDEDYEGAPSFKERLAEARKNPDATLLWTKGNEDVDDFLHEADPDVEKHLDRQIGMSLTRMLDTVWGTFDWLICGLANLELVRAGTSLGACGRAHSAPYSVIKGGFPNTLHDVSGNTISSQVPNITGLPGLLDADTPISAYTRTGFDGETYNIVFSDEFNKDGRTFWPGDDPFWEAGERSPAKETFRAPDVPRILSGHELLEYHRFRVVRPSQLPGQRLSACTCPEDVNEHPGPNVNTGRGAPEIDLLEAQIDHSGVVGSASQSMQIAPMDAGYLWKNETPYIQVWNDTRTTQNQWKGAIYQESMSLQTTTDATSYEGAGYSTFGYEYEPGGDGRITWAVNGSQTWQINADAMGPNADTAIGQRLVSEEPMSIILNLAM